MRRVACASFQEAHWQKTNWRARHRAQCTQAQSSSSDQAAIACICRLCVREIPSVQISSISSLSLACVCRRSCAAPHRVALLQRIMSLHLYFFVVLVSHASLALASAADFCPALKACPQRDRTTGAPVPASEHFDCIGRQLFTNTAHIQLDTGKRHSASGTLRANQASSSSPSALVNAAVPSASSSPAHDHAPARLTVDHDCGMLGWGNWISALPNSASLALTLGARLNIHHEGSRGVDLFSYFFSFWQ